LRRRDPCQRGRWKSARSAPRGETVLKAQEIEEIKTAAAVAVGPHVARREQVLKLQEVEEVELAVAVEVGQAGGEDVVVCHGAPALLSRSAGKIDAPINHRRP